MIAARYPLLVGTPDQTVKALGSVFGRPSDRNASSYTGRFSLSRPDESAHPPPQEIPGYDVTLRR